MNEDERERRWYEVLNLTHKGKDGQKTVPLTVVLFRARPGAAPAYLHASHGSALPCRAINMTRKMYKSPKCEDCISKWGTELLQDGGGR